METISNENQDGYIVIALGTEEAMILLQPGALFRTVMGREPALRSAARFLTFRSGEGGMLAALPRAAAVALLQSPADHPVERELQELLLECMAPGEWDAFFIGGKADAGQISATLPVPALAVDHEN